MLYSNTCSLRSGKGITSVLGLLLYANDKFEKSNVVYVDIASLPADSKDTVLHVLNKLHNTFIVELGFRWLIVVGDAKTYNILQTHIRKHVNGLNHPLA